MIVDSEQPGRVRLPAAVLGTLLEAARDGESLRAAGRAAGEALARDAAAEGAPTWDAVVEAWGRSGLGALRRERPGAGVWLLVLEERPDASAAGTSFWEGLLAGLLGSLAGEPVDVAALPPGVGPELRIAAASPAVAVALRRGFAAGWTLERMLEES
ncbi:MAG: hypothetical protein R6X22_10160 [Gemmatimonadota bacterium]